MTKVLFVIMRILLPIKYRFSQWNRLVQDSVTIGLTQSLWHSDIEWTFKPSWCNSSADCDGRFVSRTATWFVLRSLLITQDVGNCNRCSWRKPEIDGVARPVDLRHRIRLPGWLRMDFHLLFQQVDDPIFRDAGLGI